VMTIEYTPIGVIRTPWQEPQGMPIQPPGGADAAGTVEVFGDYADGLKDLEGFSHVILLYHFHRNGGYSLQVTPFMDTVPRGIFAIRAPRRPNPIGLSVVQLDRRDGAVLHVHGVDMLDGTPLIDIKPFVPEFDAPKATRTGWLEQARKGVAGHRSDDRFQ